MREELKERFREQGKWLKEKMDEMKKKFRQRKLK